MRFSLSRGLIACAVTALMVGAIAPAASAQDSAEPEGAGQQPSTLVDSIAEAAQAGADTAETLAEQLPLPAEGAGSLVFDAQQRIAVTVMFSSAPDDAMLARVGGIGEVSRVMTAYSAATVQVDPARIAELAELPGVLSAVPALQPFVGADRAPTVGAAASGTTLPAAARTDGTACGPIPIEADAPLRSDEARRVFGVDGTGVTVGIISDSFDIAEGVTDWADDVTSGALPGPGNPCGRTTPVEVISESSSATASDEGRAMAQLVHGIAPGAKLLFADAGSSGEVGMAASIDALVQAGADIIVDDISWGDELSYQQGFISSAIMTARDQGVAYFTSAGNSTAAAAQGDSAGLPLSSWQTTAYRPTACPDWVETGADDPLHGTDYDCLDFDPAAAAQTPYDTLLIAGESTDGTTTLRMNGSVGEPLLGASTDYEWRFYSVDPVTGDTTMLGSPIPRLSLAHPNFAGGVEVPLGSEVRMVMVRTGYDPAARLPAVYTLFLRGGGAILERAHMGDQLTDWVGEAPFGHGGDGSATSIASLHWDEPTKLRSYSSLGPGTLLFEAVDPTDLTAPAARLSAPLIVDTPQLASVDGTQTTFFGEDEGSGSTAEYRFYGTSAAAPNAAAVAALARSYAPALDQAALTRLMLDTAVADIVNPYAPRFADAHVFGAGRVDAAALLTALRPATPTPALAEATESTLRVSWSPVAAGSAAIELSGGGIPADQPRTPQELNAESALFTGLTADTEYTVRMTVTSEYGATATAELPLRTLAASGGGTGGDPADDGSANGPGAKVNTAGRLSSTGAPDLAPLFIGAGAVVLLGGILAAVGIGRRKRSETSTDV